MVGAFRVVLQRQTLADRSELTLQRSDHNGLVGRPLGDAGEPLDDRHIVIDAETDTQILMKLTRRDALVRVLSQTTLWDERYRLNALVASSGATARVTAFFADGRFVGSDDDVKPPGRIGELASRTDREMSFRYYTYKPDDDNCCPLGPKRRRPLRMERQRAQRRRRIRLGEPS
jgi:hypothetical protein